MDISVIFVLELCGILSKIIFESILGGTNNIGVEYY